MAACASCGADLPADARFCPRCGASVEAPASPPPAERKLATVLFADLVASTELGEQDPERTRVLLDRFYDAMAAEIELAGGTVEKFAGDAVMAAFGAPAAQEDHAERALHAALSMQHKLLELFDAQLALRIGVNTGDVVVGKAREGSSFVTGDAVNVAARLEQAAPTGGILAGERTVASAHGAFEFADPVTVEAKGKPDGVSGRRVVRALTLMRPRGVGGLREVFVGRGREVELLQATYRRVAEQREPHLVTIMGDAGVGKTRLVRELWGWLGEQDPAPLRRTGRCLSYGRAITYWPLGEILREHLGILESDTPETALRQLAGREILALALGLDVAGEIHPLNVREQLHHAWVTFVEGLAGDRPAVVLIEDLHWADEELLDLIERMLRDVRGGIFLLATSRPELLERRPAWGGGRRNSSLVWLDPLSGANAELLVAELLAAELPEQLRELLVERAGGNPFFVEELVRTLIDRKILERDGEGWKVGELPVDLEIPDSVQAVLSARMDLLPPTEKAALQAASVIGRAFWVAPVQELLGGDEPDLSVLEERDFVRPRSTSSFAGEREYVIKHALTREVAYSSLPKARRARLHAAFADWIERSRETQDEHASLLGHHFAEAVRSEDADLAWTGDEAELERLRGKALHWLQRAGDLAVARYEIDDALALFDRALELTSGTAAKAELWRKIGRTNALKFDGIAFWEAMQRSLELSDDRRVQASTYSELAFQTSMRYGMWKRAPDRRVLEGWIERALELAEPASRERVTALLAGAFAGTTADDELVEASEVAEQLGVQGLRLAARRARAMAAHDAAEYEEALAWGQRALDLVTEVDDPEEQVESYEVLIPPLIALGRFEEARRLAVIHDEVCRGLTPHHKVHGVGIIVEVEELLGGWGSIASLRERIRKDIAANLGTPCVRNPRTLLACAAAHEVLGEAEEARRLESEAEEIAMEGYPLVLEPPRLRLRIARGDLDTVDDALKTIPQQRYWFAFALQAVVLDAYAALGEREPVERHAAAVPAKNRYLQPFALRALGRVRREDDLVRQALERFEALGLTWQADQTRALLA